jgi:hypothetical protein
MTRAPAFMIVGVVDGDKEALGFDSHISPFIDRKQSLEKGELSKRIDRTLGELAVTSQPVTSKRAELALSFDPYSPSCHSRQARDALDDEDPRPAVAWIAAPAFNSRRRQRHVTMEWF